MEPVEKSYFFYKNTPEYKKIQNRLDWSIVAIIYTCIIRIAIDDTYDFFMNIIIAIAAGYVISYFYFYLITLSDYINKENSVFRILRGMSLNIITTQIKMDKPNEIKDACIYISSWCITLDNMKIFFINNSDMYSNIILIIHTLSTLVETKDVTKEEILAGLERIDDKYQKIFDVFADGNEMKDRIKSELEYLLKQSATRYPA